MPYRVYLNFLADCYNEGLEYSTIAGYRSAISAYHDPIEGMTIGKHPKVSALGFSFVNRDS